MDGTVTRRAALLELGLFLGLVFSYIWIWSGWSRSSILVVYAAGLGLTLATHLIHGEDARALGLRVDNLLPAAAQAAVPTVPLVAVFAALGIAGGHWGAEALDLNRFLRVVSWAFLQQYLLQAFIHRRLAAIVDRPVPRELLVGGIFGALHLPNPILTPVTFLAGWIFALLYRRRPNLLVLAACHAMGSTAVAFGFPPEALQRMRVGPGYFSS